MKSTQVRTANALLLRFRDEAVLEDLLSTHDVLLGDAWRAHATLCADEYFASGAYRQQAGHYFPGEYALYVNGTLSEEETAVTLMHELLHAFCDDYDLATVVSHEEIEREAVILVHDYPALVGFVRGYLGW